MTTSLALPAGVVSTAQDMASRAVRQALQTLIPTLVILAGGSTNGIDVGQVAIAAGITILVSVFRSITDLRVPDEASLGLRILDRAAAAFTGTALGYLTIDGTTAGTAIHWHAGAIASFGAAALAVLMMFTNRPPAVQVGQ